MTIPTPPTGSMPGDLSLSNKRATELLYEIRASHFYDRNHASAIHGLDCVEEARRMLLSLSAADAAALQVYALDDWDKRIAAAGKHNAVVTARVMSRPSPPPPPAYSAPPHKPAPVLPPVTTPVAPVSQATAARAAVLARASALQQRHLEAVNAARSRALKSPLTTADLSVDVRNSFLLMALDEQRQTPTAEVNVAAVATARAYAKARYGIHR